MYLRLSWETEKIKKEYYDTTLSENGPSTDCP